MSNRVIDTEEDLDGSYSAITTQPTKNEFVAATNDVQAYLAILEQAIEQTEYGTNMLNIASNDLEIATRRHDVAQNNRSRIRNNIDQEYRQLETQQYNLLHNRINDPNIKLWRYKDNLYFRANNEELIIEKPTEMQKELSSSR